MKHTLAALLSVIVLLASQSVQAQYPEPSPYPIAWQFDFEHGQPERIVVQAAGDLTPQAYWYMPYTVVNKTGEERMFLPDFQLLSRTGHIVRSDNNISPRVFEAIKAREGGEFMEHANLIGGPILLGEDQAKDGVAIWREPTPEMGAFAVFVGGLSGENVIMKKGEDGQFSPIDKTRAGEELKGLSPEDVKILNKTLQLNYIIHGDDVYPGEDKINERTKVWVMR